MVCQLLRIYETGANNVRSAYPWHELSSGSIVVDVGAGVGTSAMLIAKEHSHLRLVVQDRGKVVEDARNV
jgi:hypothetical protein